MAGARAGRAIHTSTHTRAVHDARRGGNDNNALHCLVCILEWATRGKAIQCRAPHEYVATHIPTMTPENLQAIDNLLALHGFDRSSEIGLGYVISHPRMHIGYWFGSDSTLEDIIELMQIHGAEFAF